MIGSVLINTVLSTGKGEREGGHVFLELLKLWPNNLSIGLKYQYILPCGKNGILQRRFALKAIRKIHKINSILHKLVCWQITSC